MVAGIKEKASAHYGVKAIAKRAAGQSVKQNLDCSQMENEKRRKKMTVERKTRWKYNEWRMRSWKGSWNEEGWQLEVMQTVPELKVRERMSTGEKVKCEMKDKPSGSIEEDTGEMIEWRSMSQEEMDQGWKKLAENLRMNSKRDAFQRQRRPAGVETGAKKQELRNKKVARRLLGKNLCRRSWRKKKR